MKCLICNAEMHPDQPLADGSIFHQCLNCYKFRISLLNDEVVHYTYYNDKYMLFGSAHQNKTYVRSLDYTIAVDNVKYIPIKNGSIESFQKVMNNLLELVVRRE